MTTDTWHASEDLLVRFAAVPEQLDATTAASIEQHLIGCVHCRSTVAEATPVAELDVLWDEIADAVDQVPVGRLGRVLGRVGLDRDGVRLVAATPLLQIQAFAGVLALTVAAVVCAANVDTATPFYVVAPALVLAVVAAAFLPPLEPAGEVTLATPLFGFRLFCTRAAVVLGATLVPLAAASFLLPATGWEAFAWVLPALALALGALALGTRYPPASAAALLSALWLGGLGLRGLASSRPPTLDWMLDPATQALAAALVGAAAVVLVVRRDAFDRLVSSRGGLWP